MNTTAVERIAKAVLYEGYMLYPYRPSAVKNQQRFNFGVVYPRSFSEAQAGADPWIMQTECLLQGSPQTTVEVQVRFLQLVSRSVQELVASGYAMRSAKHSSFRPVRNLEVDGQKFYSWEEAVEREVIIPSSSLAALTEHAAQQAVALSSQETSEPLLESSGKLVGRMVRTQQAIDGALEAEVHPIRNGLYKLVVRVKNLTGGDHLESKREGALLRSLISAHFMLGVAGGEFVSLLDPPAALKKAAADCHNVGSFPVLVGDEGQRDTVLASPIILYDYPQIAPESAGDLFDGTEIDEILSLRIMTMTEDEKQEMRQSDERARQMLERTETLPLEQLMKLHGVLRGLRPVKEDSR